MTAVPTDWFERRDLVGRTLHLTPLVPADAAGYVAALADPEAAEEVLAHLSMAPPRDPAAAGEIIAEALATAGRLAYAQRLKATGELVGSTSFYEINPGLRSLAIGHTWITRRLWRTGVNTESKLLMLGRAFDDLGAERVVWHTDIHNLRSQAAIERLGATKEGVLRHDRIRRDGSWRDTVQYSMLSQEWPTVRLRLQAALERAGAPSAAGPQAAAEAAERPALTMRRNDAADRFEGWLNGQLVGTIEFTARDTTVDITHTGTQPQWRGHGMAAELTRFALDDLRERGLVVRPWCPYTAAFIDTHDEYRDLLAS